MIKNQIIQIAISDINSEGQGVGKFKNMTVFVPNARLGDLVEVKVTEHKNNYYIAKIQRVLEQSPYKDEPVCPFFDKCDGCNLQNITYESQLELKKNLIQNTLQRIGKIEVENMNIVAADDPYHYRNKIELKLDDKSRLSYYNKHSHAHVPITTCPIARPALDELIPKLTKIFQGNKIKRYNPNTKTGYIRNITLRCNQKNQVMVILTCYDKDFPNKGDLIQEIGKLDGVISIYQSINRNPRSESIGLQLTLVYGETYLMDQIGEYQFQISPKAFFQVNTRQAERLYQTVLDMIGDRHGDDLLDLYCGIGTTTIYFSKAVKDAIGVELVFEAVRDAKDNSILNQTRDVEFVLGRIEDELEPILKRHDIQIITMDPPRKGLEEEVIHKIGVTNIKDLIYISCNPSTMARDLNRFGEYGFDVKKVVGVDMFPQTIHVECVVLMSRVEK